MKTHASKTDKTKAEPLPKRVAFEADPELLPTYEEVRAKCGKPNKLEFTTAIFRMQLTRFLKGEIEFVNGEFRPTENAKAA